MAGSGADLAWTSYHLGELRFNSGDLTGPGVSTARERRPMRPTSPTSPAWARSRGRSGDLDGAIDRFTEVVQRFPSPEYVATLGDLYAARGDRQEARNQYDLVRVQAELSAANGVNTDLELALFDADHGDPEAALRAARAEWNRRHSVHVADALAWALHVNGLDREAVTYSRHALSLGTRNAQFLYHAGMIELALGNTAGARDLLGRALAINPHFSVMHAPNAARALERLGGAPGMRRRAFLVLTLAVVTVLWPASGAMAHPLGNFTVSRYSGIHVSPQEIRVDYVVDMAEIPTFQEMDVHRHRR